MQYKIDIAAEPAERAVRLLLGGKLSEEALTDLDDSLTRARRARQKVYIDLSEVTLIDRKVVKYISRHAGDDVTLVNCPSYLSHWIFPKNRKQKND